MTALAYRQQGFSLLETLIAMLLFAITVMGLMRYQQVLTAQFYHYADEQRAWGLAAQALEVYPTTIDSEEVFPSGTWRINLIARQRDAYCQEIAAEVKGPHRVNVRLERLFCLPYSQPP
ncbi:Tfp pilus assembly protein PilV [Leminorella richardii]|uniref:Tfp pilus assembly protein PilV n=1 Tax=Leminorella richardii TaxID=158841 RepID=A0A2X4UKX4_9GAMM|nr:prepilin-type N-terminal cleavage/methylation domain-containing protein [Leminorella richardii]SQI36268.1 Tfp pilus assembly protein PilV [Leminorella richardii]